MGRKSVENIQTERVEEQIDKSHGVTWFQVLLIVVVAIAIYHLYLTKYYGTNNGMRIYTTNAETVYDMLYQKMMDGRMEYVMFQRVVANMEDQIKSRIQGDDGTVVLSSKAVIAGGENIIFGSEGFIENDPEKAAKVKTEIEKAVAQGQDGKKRSLRNAINDYRNEVTEQTGGAIN